MPNFVSQSQLLRKTYEKRKNDKVKAVPNPVSQICNSCWFQGLCIVRTLLRQPPRTCCVYELFGARGTQEATLEEVVKFTCETKCVERRQWVGDPCPHNEHYCDNHCPVSRYIMGLGPSNYDEVPSDSYG